MHFRIPEAQPLLRWPAPEKAWSAWRLASRCACLLLLGCGDGPTHPTPGAGVIEVEVVKVKSPVLGAEPSGLATISCDVRLSAHAGGSAANTWLGATFLWYAGADGTVLFDSAEVGQAETQGAWGAASIAGGGAQTADWRIFATIPFNAALVFRYRTASGAVATSKPVGFSCSPPGSGHSGAVAITGLSVEPTSAEVQAGDTLAIQFSAHAGAGIWQSAVHIFSGPCDTLFLFADTGVRNTTHSLSYRIPWGCPLNATFRVEATAVDVDLLVATLARNSVPVLADHRPPTFGQLLYYPQGYGSADTLPPPAIFPGEALQVLFTAYDNQGLARVRWDVPRVGYSDSVTVRGAAVAGSIDLVIPPGWLGNLDLALVALDGAGLASSAVGPEPGSLNVYPHDSAAVMFLDRNQGTRDVAIDAAAGLAYLLHALPREVEIIALDGGATLGTIAIADTAADLDLSVSGDTLLLTYPSLGALGVVSLRQSRPQAVTMPLSPLDSASRQVPRFVRMLANGRAFVTLEGNGPAAFRLLDVDPSTGVGVIRTEAGNNGHVEGPIERADDGRGVVLGAGAGWMQRYDLVGDRFGSAQSRPINPYHLSVDGQLQRAAVGTTIFDGSLQPLVEAVSARPGPKQNAVLSADGGSLFYANDGRGMIRVRTSDGGVVSAIPFDRHIGFARRSADGAWLVTISDYGSSSEVGIIDLR